MLHVADCRSPEPYAGKRVVVVDGGSSAVQVGCELAEVATVALATRAPVRFLPQIRDGKDLRHWLTATGFDRLPPHWLIHYVGGTLVLDTGRCQDALESGRLQRRPMFTALDGDEVVWGDGSREWADVVLLATGYRPDLGYLAKLGALDERGAPLHAGASPPPIPGWSVSAWSSGGPSPPTRCAVSAGTPST